MPVFQSIPADPRFQDFTGQNVPGTFYFVEGYLGQSCGHSYWWCRCQCGNYRRVCGRNLKSGHSKSCGCHRKKVLSELRTTHGASGKRVAGRQRNRTREYRSWTGMRNRCFNRNKPAYLDYGGRGIVICQEWGSFERFLTDMGPRPPGLSLGRKDNDGPYAPWNCEWQDAITQSRNRRTARMLTFRGRTQNLSAWAAELGLNVDMVGGRLKKGWSVERALTTPSRKSV